MSDELLMDLADCGSPEKLLQVIFKHHPDWTGATPLQELGRAVGIIEFNELEVDGFEGALMTNPEKSQGYILVKAGTPMPRWRFTAAHELGHFLIPSHKGNRQCTKDDLRETRRDTEYHRQETEANRFAAGLLMPKPSFMRKMGSLGEADVMHIRSLAGEFKTSMEATANRYIELTDNNCAVVFSKDGVIRYVRRSRDFPSLSVRQGDQLPAQCSTRTAPPSTLHAASSWEEHDGSVWLEMTRGQKPPTVLEQFMRQRDGYHVTMLFIEPSDDEEDDEGVEESWAVGFRKR